MAGLPPDAVQPLTLADWNNWLEANHQTSSGVWFVSYRRALGKPGVGYEEAVEEALCWGWIDSVTRKLDDERTMFRFTPRKKGSVWARSNKERVVRLESEGRMRPPGRAVIEAAQSDGSWTRYDAAEAGIVPPDLAAAFEAEVPARGNFDAFPPGEKRRILGWIVGAKTEATRARRVVEAARWCRDNVRMDDWKRKEQGT